MSSRTTEFRLLTGAVFVAALLPRLAHRGMFLDGVTYASIARNLAEGRGRFWSPFYTATLYPSFHEHPPLGFFLQSLFFRVFGDHLFVERIYTAAAACAIAALIAWTWRALLPRTLDWLPIALWILVPVVSWTIVGNLLETTMSVFVTAAVASLFARPRTIQNAKAAKEAEQTKTLRPSRPLRSLVFVGALSGLCIVCAALTKGPVGLFPLAAPVTLALLPERRRDVPWLAIGQWTTVALCAATLYLLSPARENLTMYVREQLMPSLAGTRETSGSSLTIVDALLRGVCVPLAVVVGLVMVGAGRRAALPSRERRVAVVFTLIGLAGTLPMLVSPKQTGHYLMPAVPFFAIAAAALAAPSALAMIARAAASKGAATTLTVVAGVVILAAVAATRVPALERDPARLADLDRIAAVAPRGQTVGICANVNGDWSLHAWMQRRFEISLDAGATANNREWFLKTAGDGPRCVIPHCMETTSGRGGIVLLRCR